jgi:hypothetical protein
MKPAQTIPRARTHHSLVKVHGPDTQAKLQPASHSRVVDQLPAGRFAADVWQAMHGSRPGAEMFTGVCANGAPTNTTKAEAPKEPVTPRPLGELVDAIEGFLRRYVVFPLREQATVIALWVAHTLVIEAFEFTPYLNVFSASKRSGILISFLSEILAQSSPLNAGTPTGQTVCSQFTS